ncbi:MAG: PEP-CTERM sorting domain-containing protein [Planctomycetota bacterium]
MSTYRLLAVLSPLALAAPSLAQPVVLGGDGFDPGVNENFASRSITPDNAGNDPFGSGSPGGAFGTSGSARFDVFGIANRNVGFTFADDTAGSFAADEFGIIETDKTDNFLAFQDTQNDNNPIGVGRVVWTFDVSGYGNLSTSLDFAALGNFEFDDTFTLTASIDGGPTQTLYQSSVFDEVNPATPDGFDRNYGIFLEADDPSGSPRVNYGNGFFDLAEWEFLTLSPTVPDGFAFADSDADQDGFDDLTGYRIYVETNNFGTFTTPEFFDFFDPIWINAEVVDGQVVGTQLDNEFNTVEAAIDGTGDLLTLELIGDFNSDPEPFVVDNLVLSGEEITVIDGIVGDYDDSGQVEQGDLNLVLNNWGAAAPFDPNGDPFSTPNVDQEELNRVLNNWGSTAAPSFEGAAVPEPATLALLGGLALAGLRRRTA